jgi:CheY-like chemotaxis protein
MAEMPGFKGCRRLDHLLAAYPELLSLGGYTVGVEFAVAHGVRVHDLDAGRDAASERLGLVAGQSRSLLRTLTVPAQESAGVVPIGEVVVRHAPSDAPEDQAELRIPLSMTVVDAGPALASEPDLDVVRMVAEATYRKAKDSWDRIPVVGTRNALHAAAEELRAMGEGGAPFAEKLDRRVAELDAADKRSQKAIDWLDRALTGRLIVLGDARGPVGWVSIHALPPSKAERLYEDGRRLLMARVARLAAEIEAAATGAPVHVYREGTLVEPLASVGDGLFAGTDWRLNPASDFVPSPVPAPIAGWWEEHRGLVSVRCRRHGELARFDTSRTIGMLGAAWDAAVVEYHNRSETEWDRTYDTPEYDGCEVRIEPTDAPGTANLLDVEELWITTEGPFRPWWCYELIPEAHRVEMLGHESLVKYGAWPSKDPGSGSTGRDMTMSDASTSAASRTPAPDEQLQARPGERFIGEPATSGAGRVLVVDDHSLVRQGVAEYLGRAGFEVVGSAGNGVDALQLVEKLRPEVVTTNIRMPVMDGLELTANIRERYPDVRVVILTAYPDEAFRQEARRLGAVGYVVKNEPVEGLIRSVQMAVEIARGQQG